MTDVPAGSPEVAKRRVRMILRQSREGRGLSQREAAERLLWSLSKLVRIESGVTLPAPGDVRTLLLEYEAGNRLNEAVELVRLARLPDDWDSYKDVLSRESLQLFANEKAASVISQFEPSVVPGMLQTDDYTRALLRETGSDPRLIERLVEARKRRQQLLEDPEGPSFDFIIGEAAVSLAVGGAATMRSQIEKLQEVANHPKVTLHLMPFSSGGYFGLGSAFTLLEFRDPELPDVVYLESADWESIIREDVAEVSKYNQRFAQLLDRVAGVDELPRLLDQIAAQRFPVL